MDELVDAVRLFQNNKSPGPDGIPVEFFKWLNTDGLNCILEMLNECWENSVMPEHMELANVVTLYKKEKFKTLQIIGQLLYYSQYIRSMQKIFNKDLPMVELKRNYGKNSMGLERNLALQCPCSCQEEFKILRSILTINFVWFF